MGCWFAHRPDDKRQEITDPEHQLLVTQREQPITREEIQDLAKAAAEAAVAFDCKDELYTWCKDLTVEIRQTTAAMVEHGQALEALTSKSSQMEKRLEEVSALLDKPMTGITSQMQERLRASEVRWEAELAKVTAATGGLRQQLQSATQALEAQAKEDYTDMEARLMQKAIQAIEAKTGYTSQLSRTVGSVPEAVAITGRARDDGKR